MKNFNSIFIITLLLLFSGKLSAQNINSYLFLRTPHTVNFKFDEHSLSYNSLISAGVGIAHKAKFLEVGAFTGVGDQYGFYTFFGTILKSKNLGNNWYFNSNWFGEITLIPAQPEAQKGNIYTSGLCFFLYHGFDWGSIGFPLCFGLAYQNGEISLNTRTIFNVSLNLN